MEAATETFWYEIFVMLCEEAKFVQMVNGDPEELKVFLEENSDLCVLEGPSSLPSWTVHHFSAANDEASDDNIIGGKLVDAVVTAEGTADSAGHRRD